MKNFNKTLIIFIISQFFLINILKAEIINEIIVEGNQRISSDTIKIFSTVSINEDVDLNKIDHILKEIYDTGFFENVTINLDNKILKIKVVEKPIIQNLNYEGVKADKIMKEIQKNLKLRSRSSYNEILLEEDKKQILSSLKNIGYYFSTVEIFQEKLEDNKIDITFKINLNDKAKIKKISFLGNKIFKDNKLKRIIVSEEYKFWKFISGKKFLNENIINIDTRLLKNFFLNKGYYNVKINSSYAKLIDGNYFELIFNIDAGEKIFFNDLKLTIPDEFNSSNFINLNITLNDLKGKPYSLNSIEQILNKIDEVTLLEEYQSINAKIDEIVIDDLININFKIDTFPNAIVEKINIFGNSVTRETVIRNQLLLDEGDPYNEILKNKSLNEIRNLNFFKNVSHEVLDSTNENAKILNITVEEKPTGEISAAAGVGTSGNSIGFSIRENNYLGKGISLDSNLTLSSDSIKGLFSVANPNVFNSDKSLYTTIEASELNKLTDYGYKTSKTGFSYGTNFEFLDDLRLGIGNSNYYQNIETDSTASATLKKQKGNYWDSYLKLDFDYDKRNQKFQTSSGYRSVYSIDIPFVSETYSLINSYNYQFFSELYENNITSFSFYLSSVNSISNDNVKLSERLYIPSSKLRGFSFGGVGPKDGADFVGGNYVSSINIASTLPQILENSQNTDFMIFFDAANVWGVDYDSSINDSNKLRSSIGIALDWLTPVGPMNFSLTQPLSKANTDKTETFRFNLGTTF